MKRIKEALERSRAERVEQSRVKSQVREPQVFGIRSAQLSYAQTRVVTVSEKTLKEKRIVARDDSHPVATAYKLLRTQVLRRMNARGWKTLAVTSSGPIEGKSLTAVNLAISMARQFDKTVLLADVDLRKPSIAQFFDNVPSKGLVGHLLEGVPLQEILFNPGIEHLVVLPAGFLMNRAAELLRSREMADFTNELKTRYPDRYVIFDLPPVLAGDEALSFLPCVDCVLLVIEDGKTHRAQLARACELLKDFHVIGSVLNKCHDTKGMEYSDYY